MAPILAHRRASSSPNGKVVAATWRGFAAAAEFY
jgi:hypothetical protein